MKPWPVALARSVDKRTEEELPLDITVMTRTALDHVLGECVCGGGGGALGWNLGMVVTLSFSKSNASVLKLSSPTLRCLECMPFEFKTFLCLNSHQTSSIRHNNEYILYKTKYHCHHLKIQRHLPFFYLKKTLRTAYRLSQPPQGTRIIIIT